MLRSQQPRSPVEPVIQPPKELLTMPGFSPIFTPCMDEVTFKDTRISELVDRNYVYAYTLSYLGIHFYEYGAQTLGQVCAKHGLNLQHVIRELEAPSHLQEAELPLVSYPIDLIIEYLKHTHFLFVKHKLPYIVRLVDTFKANDAEYDSVERDLKIVYPLFVKDFIEHVYEEEDTLFHFILALERASRQHYVPTKLYYLLEEHSIRHFAVDHEAHDDEMQGIRNITRDYALPAGAPLHVKVLYNELKGFEKSLITHARIENEILFPKAMELEEKVRLMFFGKAKFN
jgi:regulator of cell morphogenesis and NO signaling